LSNDVEERLLIINHIHSTMSHPVEVVIMLTAIAFPAIIIAYLAKKHRSVVKPVGAIVAMAGATVFILFAFGIVSTDTNMVPQQDGVEETTKEVAPAESILASQILKDSFRQGNPDYEPDVAVVSQGYTVEWTNRDSVRHTVTSAIGNGKTFDSGIMNGRDVFTLDTSNLAVGEYEYLCTLHPWMVATLVIEEPKE